MARGKVLILEDDILTGKTIQQIVMANDYEARLAINAGDFFMCLREWEPDYIALDLIMPNMDGVQVLTQLAQLQCKAAIIITSGVGKRILEAAMRSAREQGLHVLGVLGKPFNASSMKKLLDSHTPAHFTKALNEGGEAVASGVSEAPEPVITADALRLAIEHHQLFNVYQPKVDAKSLTLNGFEVLVRWHHPEAGVVSPNVFIPLAEAAGLIDALTFHVMHEALAWFSAQLQQRQGFGGYLSHTDNIGLSLNISAVTLNSPDVLEQLSELCSTYRVTPQQVIFELTESSAMRDPVQALTVLTRLRMKGFRLSIDDFGTGYSSMVQLVRLPFSEIKIDKSFVISCLQSAESRAVIRSIIELAHSLNLKVTAEGIEDEATLQYLREQKCDLLQGYHIARPMKEADVRQWLQQRYPEHEQQRLAALQATRLLESGDEQRFDSLIALLRRLFDVPYSFFCLIDSTKLRIKARSGLTVRELPRQESICDFTIRGDGVFVVEDAWRDPRFIRLPLISTEPFVRFYAGMPVDAGDGSWIGTVCVLDVSPRRFTDVERDVLREFAKLIENEMSRPSAEGDKSAQRLKSRNDFEYSARVALGLCARLKRPCAMLILDVDKSGPAATDGEVIRDVAELLTATLRRSDVIAYFAPEPRFVAFLACVDAGASNRIIERLISGLDAMKPGRPALATVRIGARLALSMLGESESLQSFYSRTELAAVRLLSAG